MKKSLLSLAIIVIFSVVGIQLFVIPLFENKVRHPTEKWALELLTSGAANIKRNDDGILQPAVNAFKQADLISF